MSATNICGPMPSALYLCVRIVHNKVNGGILHHCCASLYIEVLLVDG